MMGMVAEQGEAGGWNEQVRPQLAETNATLGASDSGPVLNFSLPTVPSFAISQPETIFITLPTTAVSSAAPIRVRPPLIIATSRRRAR